MGGNDESMKPSFQIFNSEFGVRSACPPHGFGRRAELPFTSRSKSTHASRITHHAIAAALLFAFFALLHPLLAGEPFLQPFPNFIAIDSAVDSAGNTYLLSKPGAIKKLN